MHERFGNALTTVTAQVPVIGFLVAMAGGLVERARRRGLSGDAGVSTVEWVVIGFLLAGLAVAAGVIITSKVTTKANSWSL